MRATYQPFYRTLQISVAVTFLFFLSLNVSYANTGKLTGQITDANTGECIRNANVSIEGQELSATSGNWGKYTLPNIPPGVYNINVTCVDYESQVVNDVHITSNKKTKFDIKLTQSKIVVPEVPIECPMRQLPQKSSSPDQEDKSANGVNTGRLHGRVTDVTTGKGIVGANVIIVGQDFGAATDLAGYFTILNIPSGVYDVVVTCVGYHECHMNDVYIAKDTQSKINFQLTHERLDRQGEVRHLKPQIKLEGSSTKKVISKPTIDAIKPENVKDLLKITTGFRVDDEQNIHVRGSRSADATIVVEGVDLRDQLVDPQVNINLSSAGMEIAPTSFFSIAPKYGQEPNNEEYGGIIENEFQFVDNQPLSTFSIDVDAASYSNCRRFLNEGRRPPINAIRIEEFINYFTYDYPQPEGKHPFSITTEMSECPWNEEHKLVHIGLQGKKVDTDELPPSNLVFLIDVSGSMKDQNKLPLLKKSFHLLVDQLRNKDRVAIVTYASNVGVALPSTSGRKKEKIHDAIDRLNAGGSTAGGAGIQMAYEIAEDNKIRKGNNRVILASDGDFNVGISDTEKLIEMIEKEREKGIFLTILGFGEGNLKEGRMEQLADKGNGNYAYIDNLMEGKKVFVNEFGGTLFTIAKDVKLQVEFNPTKVKSYKLIGYENRMLEDRDFNDDTKDAGELGSGHTVTALYEIILAGPDDSMEDDDGRPEVDDLKYQEYRVKPESFETAEVLTVKFRYKKPNGFISKLLSSTVLDSNVELSKTSENFRFSAAVASFGLILRDSKLQGDSTIDQVIEMAKESRGKDDEGYRAEFIRIAEIYELTLNQ
ncbi:MAG: DUF3520 domain-containing protein [Calditrichaeota bacterium]|nr:DUF3520 domain-containing protein [Calditrichota bacterium]